MAPAENKEIGDTDPKAIRKQAEEFNSWLARMEAMDSHELKQYKEQNKHTFNSQKKDAIKKLLQKDKKKRKKRIVLSPILGAVMKFHRDDDVDPAAAGAGA